MGTTRSFAHIVLGERPSRVLGFVVPTILAVVCDFVLRPRSLLAFEPLQWLNYFGSTLASAGFWGGPLWLVSGLFHRTSTWAKVALYGFFALLVFPLETFCIGGQVLYFHVFNAYMARDTVRLGIALRGTLGAWLSAWGGSVVLMAALGLGATVLCFLTVKAASGPTRYASRALPAAGFCVAAWCFWVDFVESRSLQAAPPDTCFIHGAIHALRAAVTHAGWARRGMSLRAPEPLPPLTRPAHPRSVMLVVTESVRADALCSAPPPLCSMPVLDAAAADRVPLGRLTTQSPGTLSSCVMLWTGLGPDADMKTMLHAPVLWEVARALGYRTAYVGSQNLRYEDFAAFFERAGLDVLVSAADLGGAGDPHLGAPDENATARMIELVRTLRRDSPETPYFATLHLSNTHWPYRVDPDLQPNSPHDASPFGDTHARYNHYLNSVALQARTVGAFLGELRALPGWEDTVVVFVSDHGEEFREHGANYHLSNLFEEQVRIPGFLVAGDHALEPAERQALAAWAPRRTYTRDVHATLLDLLSVLDARATFPFADKLLGRSLLRPPTPDEPVVPLSTASGVWDPDITRYGTMQGDVLVIGGPRAPWRCYDAHEDPTQHKMANDPRCLGLAMVAAQTFGAISR
jgi:arylsulfatase A-like enzyme